MIRLPKWFESNPQRVYSDGHISIYLLSQYIYQSNKYLFHPNDLQGSEPGSYSCMGQGSVKNE